LFLRYGLAISGIGAICGLTAAFAMTRLIGSLLFEVSPADPVSYIAVSKNDSSGGAWQLSTSTQGHQGRPVEALRAE
jgi:ABC-type antimicrobial peptide transport system permease subunit